jgi:hypothetical protein
MELWVENGVQGSIPNCSNNFLSFFSKYYNVHKKSLLFIRALYYMFLLATTRIFSKDENSETHRLIYPQVYVETRQNMNEL